MIKIPLSLAASLAVVVTLLVLPQTRWTMIAGAEVATGKWRPDALSQFNEPNPPFLVTPRFVETTPTPFDLRPDSSFTVQRMIERTRQTPSDVAAYAHALRFISMAPARRPKPNDEPRLRERWSLALPLAKSAKRLDPDNAFFPLSAAAAYLTLGDMKSCREEMRLAARAQRYEIFVDQEIEERMRILRSQHGYRGEIVDTMVMAGILFPQYGPTLRTAEALLEEYPDDLGLREDVIRVGIIMSKTSAELIGISVGRAMIYRGILGRLPKGEIRDPQAFAPNIASLSERAKKEGHTGLLGALDEVLASGILKFDLYGDVAMSLNSLPALSAPSLVVLSAALCAIPALILLVPLGGLGRARSKGRYPLGFTVLLTLASAAFVSAFLMQLGLGVFDGWLLGAALIVSASLLILRPGRGHSWLDVSSWTAPLVALVLLAASTETLRWNERVRAQNVAWMNEANAVREANR